MKVSPESTSVVENVPTTVSTAAFSATELPERLMVVGVSLTLVTEIVSTFSNVSPAESVVRTRME